MHPASLASALAGPQMSNVRKATAAKMVRMNAEDTASIVQLDAAQKNITSLANVVSGVGQNLHISV